MFEITNSFSKTQACAVNGETPQANQQLVILIPELLEPVGPVVPECGKLDLGSESLQDTIASASGDRRTLMSRAAHHPATSFSPMAPLRLDGCDLIHPNGLCAQLGSSSVWYSLFRLSAKAANRCTSGSLIICRTSSCRRLARQTGSVESLGHVSGRTRRSPRRSRPGAGP